MLWTLARHDLASIIKRSIPASKAPPSLSKNPGNLYEVLSRTPLGGVGRHVYQTRWTTKKIPDCYWKVTRTQFKCEGKHGKAWGLLFWKGKQVSEQPERIRGSLKYSWNEGRSEGVWDYENPNAKRAKKGKSNTIQAAS
ncbi:hypothetical protein ARMSODRAFT_956622 [Armillaria solidipes]|uniref:Uncharacterized protein n=1 Tax=Armillaria solidipes TaxID=1076256 RepID=A0A2H3BLP0_9AGAR|nr:hypothetical protein ARMSODRAFT_956622 [Armillaria solidipes]